MTQNLVVYSLADIKLEYLSHACKQIQQPYLLPRHTDNGSAIKVTIPRLKVFMFSSQKHCIGPGKWLKWNFAQIDTLVHAFPPPSSLLIITLLTREIPPSIPPCIIFPFNILTSSCCPSFHIERRKTMGSCSTHTHHCLVCIFISRVLSSSLSSSLFAFLFIHKLCMHNTINNSSIPSKNPCSKF